MQIKQYQQTALDTLRAYLIALKVERARREQAAAIGIKDYKWDEQAWREMNMRDPYLSRRNPLGDAVPSVCLKIPTGGGKTLLAVKAVDLINTYYRDAQTGLVLWIVPTSQIYNQTLTALRDRSHPYRVHLNMASGDRTLILEKGAVFTPDDVRDNLVILLLMLPSANRQAKETLRIFRDRGGFEQFFPREEDYEGHTQLLKRVPNLDVFESDSGIGGRIAKSSLGNTLRLLNPPIVLDEGHKAYGQLAQETLLGFNPSFILELSATPTRESNKLVKVSGQDLWREGMIKLDINVYNRASADWRDTMRASLEHRERLERIANEYGQDTGVHIRPICLVQVERTGQKQRGAGFIHAEEVRDFLTNKCAVLPEHIAVKSSEQDEIENINLLSPDCPIRYIITKQALQEGWDCPFAYILTVLTNPRQASASITQLVGRVLRQPYAQKTGRIELDESYVYCYRDTAGEIIHAVRAGLAREGLEDMTGRVVPAQESAQHTKTPIRPQFANYAGKVYLPCFVVRDEVTSSWREVSYEMDVLSRIDWTKTGLRRFDELQLNPARTQNAAIAVGLNSTMPGLLKAETAADMPLDLTFITRQIGDIVPSPWRAHEFTTDAVDRLRKRYEDAFIRRDLAFVIEELKKLLQEQRVVLAKEAFDGLIQRKELRFILLSGCIGAAVPDEIESSVSPFLITDTGSLPARSLFDYRDDDFNLVERDVVLYLEQQDWVVGWIRNFSGKGYRLQGWKPNKVYPDFMVFSNRDPSTLSEFTDVYVLETKGLHLKGNEDTEYKQQLFDLCNGLSKPRPWDEVAQEIAEHEVQFKVIFEDEWRRVINALAANG
jgi:type III restriction enzyme